MCLLSIQTSRQTIHHVLSHILLYGDVSHPISVLQIGAIEWVDDAHVCLLQGHHLALDLQGSVAHVQTLITQFALTAVSRIADIGLQPVYGCRPEQCGDSMRHGVLLC